VLGETVLIIWFVDRAHSSVRDRDREAIQVDGKGTVRGNSPGPATDVDLDAQRCGRAAGVLLDGHLCLRSTRGSIEEHSATATQACGIACSVPPARTAVA